jgi:hypothetical protein
MQHLSAVEMAAHLTVHVFPRLSVRQWVLSVPKRLRYFMQRDGATLNMVLRIFLRVIAQTLQSCSPGVAQLDKAALHIGAVAQVQTDLRRRILRAFVGRGLLESVDAKEMLAYQHSGFSVDAGVCIEAHDRAALERLLRYCARPPFAMDRLRKEGTALVYRCAKQHSEPASDKRGARADELHLTPLELIYRIAALVPPPRTHRHRYFGVLVPQGNALPPTPEPAAPAKRSTAHYLWAVLIARIYEVLPLL